MGNNRGGVDLAVAVLLAALAAAAELLETPVLSPAWRMGMRAPSTETCPPIPWRVVGFVCVPIDDTALVRIRSIKPNASEMVASKTSKRGCREMRMSTFWK